MRQADVIFDGEVTGIASRAVVEGGREKIVTDVTFRVNAVLKGEKLATTVLEFAGGVVGDVGYKLADVPSFTTGERSVIFAVTAQHMLSPIVGMMQGRFRVVKDGPDGAEIMHASDGTLLRDVASIGSAEAQPLISPRPAMSLDAFKAAIAAEVRQQVQRH